MFGLGEKKFIGIDVGTSNIKMVELKISGNKPVLSNYARVRINGLMGDNDLKASYFETVLPEYIRRMVKTSGISGRNAYFSIPSFGGLITLIEFPDMSKDDLNQAIKFEAHKYVPISLDDVVLSWDIVGKKDQKKSLVSQSKEAPGAVPVPEGAANGKVQVLLVAAPKNKVIKYEKLAGNTELHLKSIEIESFSLVRSLVGNDQGNFVVVDIGSRICNIILVEKGVIKANRNIDAGGRDISKVIAKSMNIDDERADKLKVSGKNFLDGDSSITFPVIDLIVGEILRVMKAYYKTDSKAAVDGIILSGGTAGLPGLDEYFSKALGIKTIIGNPLGRIEYDKRLEPKARELGNQFSVAIGLALGGVDENFKK
ncbi:MAG: pilus assembly protein PilM [Parcubacteria group bacterium]